MCLSTFLAQVIGSYLFFSALAMLVHQNRFKKTCNEILGNQVLLTLTGSLALIFGLVIVVEHNLWISEWPVLITLVGWVLVLKGLMKFFIPEIFVKLHKDLMGRGIHSLITWVRLAIGVILIWAGFSQV